MDYNGYFMWDCPNCGYKNEDSVDHAMTYTCICKNNICHKEYEIYLDVQVSIEKIIKVH